MFEHGRQFRRDLIERTQCLKLLVAVTILTCPTDEERAEILNKWIQIAIDAKTAVGNLFAFSTIMLGLCMPQIQKLEGTWYLLRQRFTDSAFNFEAKLRPILKSMNDCSNPQAPNTTIPHMLPYILIKDRTIDDLLGNINSGHPDHSRQLIIYFQQTLQFPNLLWLKHVLHHLKQLLRTLGFPFYFLILTQLEDLATIFHFIDKMLKLS